VSGKAPHWAHDDDGEPHREEKQHYDEKPQEKETPHEEGKPLHPHNCGQQTLPKKRKKSKKKRIRICS
jgi:hypothetical protein